MHKVETLQKREVNLWKMKINAQLEAGRRKGKDGKIIRQVAG